MQALPRTSDGTVTYGGIIPLSFACGLWLVGRTWNIIIIVSDVVSVYMVMVVVWDE